MSRAPHIASPTIGTRWEEQRSLLDGSSAATERLRSQIARIAQHFRTAVITGEAGSGKKRVARELHRLACGETAPFVVVDLRELDRRPPISSPFQTDTRSWQSLFHTAEGGMLVLTHLPTASAPLQEALASALRDRPASLRIVACADEELRGLARARQLRQDLYSLLASVEIAVPPFRERLDDLPELGASIASAMAATHSVEPIRLSPEALSSLSSQPGLASITEFEELLRELTLQHPGKLIDVTHLPSSASPEAGDPVDEGALLLQDAVNAHVLKVLRHCEGNKVRTAELLGISRSTLYRMLEQIGPAWSRPATAGGVPASTADRSDSVSL